MGLPFWRKALTWSKIRQSYANHIDLVSRLDHARRCTFVKRVHKAFMSLLLREIGNIRQKALD